MIKSNPIEKLTPGELQDYFDWDGVRGFYEATLEKARERLDLLNGLSDHLLTKDRKSV